MLSSDFKYDDERFADIQLLRYRLNGFNELSLKQKKLIYYLSEATLFGRDITFDQNCKYNLRIRKILEVVFIYFRGDKMSSDFLALTEYLKRIWFSNGIHHHYSCDKFVVGFSADFLRKALNYVPVNELPLQNGEDINSFCDKLFPIIFDSKILSKRVNKSDGDDIIKTSACNFYENITQKEAETFYASKKELQEEEHPMYGLNSKLIKIDDKVEEQIWRCGGMYGCAINRIIFYLNKALDVTENEAQRRVVSKLIKYYNTGDLKHFDEYSIEWLKEQEGRVDFINGFIEVYGDPLGLKGTWEGIVEYKDIEATKRTEIISKNAQWFEDHSPVDSRFRKKEVKGVTANVICAAMLGGEEYPSSAIGINLPNANWIRARYGSKSVTIGNLTEAYNKAAKGNGFKEEFVIDDKTRKLIDDYGDVCDDLHTDLHECLGHGSGQLLPGVDSDSLNAYGNTIEEARADLFGLYYIADKRLVDLGLMPNGEAFKSQYYTYMMNGLLTQLTRIKLGDRIEEAHMRNRALIAHWCYEKGRDSNVVEYVINEGKRYIKINDYIKLRTLFGNLLAEVQRIKSEGDFQAARELVEKYAVKIDYDIHREILGRFEKLNIAPYKGFINPVLTPKVDKNGEITDILVDYSESYEHQMMRYSHDYSTLSYVN